MTNANANANAEHGDSNPRSLASRLRTTLHAARGNLDVRERLAAIVSDPTRFDPIVREFGPGHSLVRALMEIARHDKPQPKRRAWSPAGC